MNQSADLPPPDRALAIGAHPDDIEFGAGGTLAKWAGAGCEITMVIVTDGSKGTWDPAMDSQRLVAVRIDEQREAARTLGASHVVHLGHVDGELMYTMELRAEICLQIRMTRPDVVLGHDPWRPYQLHPDHRATGLATVDGVVAARDHLFFPDQRLAAHRPSQLLLWAAAAADHREDIGSQLGTKTDALLCHSSQGTTTMNGAHDSEVAGERFRDQVAANAALAAEGSGLDYAEAFKRLTP